MARQTLPHRLQQLHDGILAAAIDAVITPLTITDNTKPDYPLYYANQAFYDMSGYSEKEVIDRNCRFLQGPGTNMITVQQIGMAVNKGQAIRVTLKNYRKDGSEYWNDLMIVPLRDSGGTITHHIGMQQDVTERIHHARDLELAQKRLLMTLKTAKDEFVSLSSHQLRTPATSVKQYLSMILDGYVGTVPRDILPYLQTAYESNERQLQIIDSLLKTAQLDTGNSVLVKRPESVSVLVSEVISDYSSVINMRRQTVRFKTVKDSVALIDSAELRIVFSNLLENASRYSLDGQFIDISIKRTSKTVIVKFKDHGVGIAPDDHKRIFDKFVRINNTLSDTVSGTGLGLYFVRRIIRLHGARLYVRSALGKGSSFSVILPI